jgi:hypothetical protein
VHCDFLQVFEFGVAHSIIIGVTIGVLVSNSPCTIQPLFAALTFHQFFEGLALGGCMHCSGMCTIPTPVISTVHACSRSFICKLTKSDFSNFRWTLFVMAHDGCWDMFGHAE